MKKLLPLIAFLFSVSLFGQPFGNEWINYSQKYYKFKLAENGIFRIDYQTLFNASIPVNSLDPRNLQLYSKGHEVPIYIQGENDGSFNIGDYIEFYAEKNDGWLDTALYNGRNKQPNPYYSVINDTITYYLTWNNSTSNLRFQEENAIDFGNYFPASFILKENLQVYNSSYYDGQILGSGATNPEYTEAEGWMDSPLNLGNGKNKYISTPNRYGSGPFVDFEIQVAGASNWAAVNNGDHHLKITFGNQVVDEIFEGYELKKINRSFSPTELVRGQNTIRFESIDDRNTAVDRTALAYMRILYPHTLSLSGAAYFEFQLDDAGNQSAQYLELNFFNGGSSPILYDLTNNKKVRVVETLSNYKTIVPNGNGRKRCIIANESEVKSITSLQAVEETGTFSNLEAGLNDSAFIIISHPSLFSRATTYASYRRSRGLTVKVVDVEQLYDQFAYGIPKHPLAIRNFMNHALTNWTFAPTHLFLIGKSITAKLHRKADNTNGSAQQAYDANLLPSMGNPSADNLLISGLKGTNLETPIPIGRLSAKNPDEIGIYLDKMIEYESAPYEKWMKRALHFAGGKSALETNRHEGYLNSYAQDFESTFYGGKAFLFQKSSSAPYQTSLGDSIRTLINNGVSLMTFFGHSGSTGGFDISIDSPDNLRNKGKYPVLIGNSCYAGNYHQFNTLSTSEEYVLQKDAGVIGFIANGNLGVGFYLNEYSSALYDNFTKDYYGKSIAECMRLAVRDVQSANTDELLKNVCIEMSLQGDPALVINAPKKRDYKVDESSLLVNPAEVTTDLDSFYITINLENIGLATRDSLLISLTRKFANNGQSDSIILKKVAPVFYESEIAFSFPINILTDVGENKFTFLADPFNEVDELDETNNRIDFTVLIRSGEIIPVHPYNYSIVGKQAVALRASTAFAFEEEKRYVFELDTTVLFNSPAKATTSVVISGGLIEWKPASLQNMTDSAVYFWRVSKAPAPGENNNWRQFSFQYLDNESGFAQDHFQQFNDNRYLFMNQDQSRRRFEFTDRASELSIVTYGTPDNDELNNIRYTIDADAREKGSCFASPSFLIAVMDSVTLDSWLSTRADYGQANFSRSWCSPFRFRAEEVFSFQSLDSAQMGAMKDFLENSVPDGHYVAIYNWLNINYEQINAWDSTVLKVFEGLGATVLADIQNNIPFIVTLKMGDPNSVQEIRGSSVNDRIQLSRTLLTSADFGQMTSVRLGPSEAFERLAYEFKSIESNSADNLRVDLVGFDNQNNENILFSSGRFKIDTMAAPLVDGNQYNELQLQYRTTDTLNQTPAQLKRWQVSYKALPDAALSPNIYFSVNNDSLQQGEFLELEVAVKNVSETDLDSISVAYSVIDGSNIERASIFKKYAPIPADSVLIADLQLSTTAFKGANTLLIEVNPQQEQKEQFTFNNFGQFNFTVASDRINPLLDVTFDGRYILNREIVSSEPTILINLTDNNEFLALDDTSNFSIYLLHPNGEEELIDFNNTGTTAYNLQFNPAQLPENKASIIFEPVLKKDGIYRLKVQAKDKSGNLSGSKAYQVEFEIVTKSSISHLLNYPNPFSTSTQFVFTLTGNQVPDEIQIQIMTVTGKVVREIDENELGPIHIGNNITEFKWDGKDEFGDQLANGVYFYRVKVKMNGNQLEKRRTAADKAFVNDFGKMYLIR